MSNLAIVKQILSRAAENDNKIFLNTFKGRPDVYAMKWKNKEGKTGFSPACKNKFKAGCNLKCCDCSKPEYWPFNSKAVELHLSGKKVIGVYPLLSDNTSWFVAGDFDGKNGDPLKDAKAFIDVCEAQGICAYLERSQSGNGYHVWIFFDNPIPAWKSRTVVKALLVEAQINVTKGSFDRILPSQDRLSGKGFGNLIALPLQSAQKVKEGKSVFLNTSNGLEPYPNQFEFLKTIKRVTEKQFDYLIYEWNLKPEKKNEAKQTTPVNSKVKIEERLGIEALEQCEFYQHCKKKPKDVTEPHWFDLATVLVPFKKGREKFHELSRGDNDRYDESETNAKFDNAVNSVKQGLAPHTCETIRKNGFTCEKDCGVKSPCSLFIEKDLIDSLPTLTEISSLDLSVEYIVEGLIPEKGITVFYGKGGRGKTTLMIQIGHAVAEGISFEGLDTKKSPVVYIDFDNPLNIVVEKAKRLGGSNNFHYWHVSHERRPSKLDKDDWEIYKKLPKNSLLIFDTLKSCQGLDMNKDETMAFILERFRELRDLGFTIVLLHHTPKSSDTIPKNSTTITDNADHVLGLIPLFANKENDDGLLQFGCGENDKSRYPKNHICLSFDGEVFERVADPEDVEFENIKRTIAELSKDGLPNQSKIVDYAKNTQGLNRNKVLSLLKRGEGKFWKSSKIKEQKNMKVYELIDVVELSAPIGSNN